MLLLSEFYLHHFRLCYPWILIPVLEELSSSRRNNKLLKIGDGPETRDRVRVLQRLRNKGARKHSERGRARHTAQTSSERRAASQWKSTRERGAETPEERETRNGSSAIRHFEQGNEDLTE